MEELSVKITQEVGKVSFSNFDEIKENIQEMMSLYEGAEFSDASMAMAKKEVAALRKMSSAIDTKRKEVKKKCLEPYEEFESKANELKDIINTPILLIDSQISNYEQRRKEEKKIKIAEIYAECIDDFAEFLPLEKIYDIKWENVSTSVAVIKKDIENAVNSVAEAIVTITSMNSESVQAALDRYKKDLSLSNTIAYINNYENQKIEILKRQEEQRRLEEENSLRERQRELERVAELQRQEDEKKYLEEQTKEAKKNIEEIFINELSHLEINDDDLSRPFEEISSKQPFVLKIKATMKEFKELTMYMDSVGIDYEV